jgi:Tfp pilus assembly protein PilE
LGYCKGNAKRKVNSYEMYIKKSKRFQVNNLIERIKLLEKSRASQTPKQKAERNDKTRQKLLKHQLKKYTESMKQK